MSDVWGQEAMGDPVNTDSWLRHRKPSPFPFLIPPILLFSLPILFLSFTPSFSPSLGGRGGERERALKACTKQFHCLTTLPSTCSSWLIWLPDAKAKCMWLGVFIRHAGGERLAAHSPAGDLQAPSCFTCGLEVQPLLLCSSSHSWVLETTLESKRKAISLTTRDN